MPPRPNLLASAAVPRTHHIDRWAATLAAEPGDDDDVLTTREVALWLKVSEQWLETGRSRGYGPPFERISPKVIRYRRGRVRAWLDQRAHNHTAEYA